MVDGFFSDNTVRMKKTSRRSLVALLALVSFSLAWAVHRNSGLHSRFRAIQPRMSQAEVVRLLGTPSWIEPCGQSFGARKPNCTKFIYRNSFAPLVPEYHSVSLDQSGHVVDTYIYSSP